MYRVDVYLRVRRVVMVEGMSIRVTARTFGLHRDTVRKMLAYSAPPGCWRRTGWGGERAGPWPPGATQGRFPWLLQFRRVLGPGPLRLRFILQLTL